VDRIPLGSASFDNLLGGGIEAGSVTLLYGEAGTGKTNICLQMAYNLIKDDHLVVYVDTEGLSSDRIDQIFKDGALKKNLLVFKVHSFEEQIEQIAQAVKLAEINEKVGLVIVDSMTVFYRLKSDDSYTRGELARETDMLTRLSRKRDIPILLTSQVYADIGSGTVELLGGHAMRHNAKTIIRLDKRNNGRRAAVIVKHRSLPEGKIATYRIVESGIESD
jgi:DNA repair and recombination protein RadB